MNGMIYFIRIIKNNIPLFITGFDLQLWLVGFVAHATTTSYCAYEFFFLQEAIIFFETALSNKSIMF